MTLGDFQTVKDIVALASLPAMSQPWGGLHRSSGQLPVGAPGNDPQPHKPADDSPGEFPRPAAPPRAYPAPHSARRSHAGAASWSPRSVLPVASQGRGEAEKGVPWRATAQSQPSRG